ncbi:MAG: hypothetical protein ISS89_02660 [Candidatus Omnitrophica bacterium]|nr:hypothetical protein [Candidatus Omnitrophota bacterium]
MGQSASSVYLCDFGIALYREGKFDEALSEFKKALLAQPDNIIAQEYMNLIFQESLGLSSPVRLAKEPAQELTRDQIMDRALSSFTTQVQGFEETGRQFGDEKPKIKAGPVEISGEVQLRAGFTPQSAYWKRANFNLNERDWRMLSGAALDRKENTYDPRIYDRLRIDFDTGNEEGFNFHSNITVDPWSFTGRSNIVNLHGSAGDVAQFELDYWSNTGYTIDHAVNTIDNGDIINLPEIKVVNGHTASPVSITTVAGNTFTIPEVKIYRRFQPVREFWFDYLQDDLKIRVFPVAYENQAVTFDDPLRLSNNRIWWEDSPWLHSWKPGRYNAGASPVDFTKGYWDNSFSFSARDSEGRRLTALRGGKFEFQPGENTSLVTSIATPMNPWQDYTDVDNLLSATRAKHSLTDSIDLGLSLTTRIGFNLDDAAKFDAWNYAAATDFGYEIIDGIKTSLEVAYSQSRYDIANSEYRTRSRGFAYYASLIGRYPFEESIMHTEFGYDGIRPEKYDTFFTKFKIYAARMDESFDASLSNYAETRDDEFWSRHIHFRKPFGHYYQGEGQMLTWDDIKTYRIGNGIDIDRSTFGLRVESLLWDNMVDNLFDARNVHANNGKFLENVLRDELTIKANEKLTGKFLGIYHRLHKTYGGIDPYIFNSQTREYYTNDYIEDGKDPSVATGSLGLEYQFLDWLALNGVWEYTNDIAFGLDNFPRRLLNEKNRTDYSYEEDRKYRDMLNYLYSQQYFPRPPYPYYNVFKAGLRLTPIENLQIYLDYTRNPYEKAGPIDDNMNHVGFEVSYLPMPKLGLFFRYTYSRWQDINKLILGDTGLYGHHNFFAEAIFRKSEDEDISFQYGESSRNPYMGGILDVTWDPYGGSLSTIDTQHIFRLYYRRKF